MSSNTPDTRWLSICRLGTAEKQLMLKTRDGRLWMVPTNTGSARGAWVVLLALAIMVFLAVVLPGTPGIVPSALLGLILLSGCGAGAVTVWQIRRAELPIFVAATEAPSDPHILKRFAMAGIRSARILSVSLIVAPIVLLLFSVITARGEDDLRATFVVAVASYFIVVVAYLRPFASWRAAKRLLKNG
ncbi:hypothetical protein [Lysinibacter cavernae]|uniref:Protein-S-isoprenylcysteine O-methyltransferase Ste14 n=1 Tax=Lysinibacter cavernae TaxID=1640652 RepID=A0A7X5R102_9MICO|nr:hypothetical protein [Lysinibacter cavernae]NIH53658.1 protein-S-isoprenylcysteine O-methyltransferase Ste14 [Lysinibacter cavernae]